MARLRGEGLGTGMALGTAAVIRMRGGMPQLPEVPERVAQMLASRRLSETPEVVLVAPDYGTALALAGSLKWGKVVAIVAERADLEPVVPSFPAVVNVAGLMNTVADDMLMLVDAGNGVVLSDPDPVYLAQYTSEHARVAPKQRYHLEETHLPAQTRDGRTVRIVAAVSTPTEITIALEQGADALFVPFDCPLLPLFAEESARRQHILTLTQLAAGKPLYLSDDYGLPLPALLEAGTQAQLTLLEPVHDDLVGLGLRELQDRLSAEQEICIENDTPCQVPRLGVDVADHATPVGERWKSVEDWVNALAEHGATRLVFSWRQSPELKTVLPLFAEIMAAAEANLLPVYAATLWFEKEDADRETSVWPLVGAGAAGLLVNPDEVQAIKSLVQELFYHESREGFRKLLETL